MKRNNYKVDNLSFIYKADAGRILLLRRAVEGSINS